MTTDDAPSDQMLTVDQVADMLQVKRARIHDNWREWGLPCFRIGNHLRFRRSEIDEWLNSRREA